MRNASPESKRRFWEHHLAECNRSGLSQAQYCRQNGISVKTFGYWKRKLGRCDAPACLVEVPAEAVRTPSFYALPAPLRLEVNGSYRIEIEKGFDPATLEQVLAVLGRL